MSEIVSISRPAGNRPAVPNIKQETTTFPSEVISLPSKGWFYPENSPLAEGQLELKIMTAKEEDILTSKNLIQKGIVLDKLLESLIIRSDIKPVEMLNCDRNAAFVAIRRMAYGDEYNVVITCPRCGVDNAISIDLGKLDNKPFEFEKYTKGKNEFNFELPISKKVVTFKLLTKIDEDVIEMDLKGLQKISPDVSSEVTTRLKQAIIAIDSDVDKISIRKFVDTMRAGDSLALRSYMKTISPDVDMTFDFQCKTGCTERREEVPVGVNFFWPNG